MLLTAASMTAKEMVWLRAFAAPVAAMPMALDSRSGQHQLPTSAGTLKSSVPTDAAKLLQLVGSSSTTSSAAAVTSSRTRRGRCHAPVEQSTSPSKGSVVDIGPARKC